MSSWERNRTRITLEIPKILSNYKRCCITLQKFTPLGHRHLTIMLVYAILFLRKVKALVPGWLGHECELESQPGTRSFAQLKGGSPDDLYHRFRLDKDEDGCIEGIPTTPCRRKNERIHLAGQRRARFHLREKQFVADPDITDGQNRNPGAARPTSRQQPHQAPLPCGVAKRRSYDQSVSLGNICWVVTPALKPKR